MSIDWGQAGNVVFSGLFIVFAALLLLILLVMLMGKALNTKPQPQSQGPSSPPPSNNVAAPVLSAANASDTGETAAVISAAVAAFMSETAPGASYAVTSVTQRPKAPSKELRPVWGFAGMRQNTESF